MTPPESSMKNDLACVMTANWPVPAVPWLPSASRQVLARKLTVTLPVPSWPLNV